MHSQMRTHFLQVNCVHALGTFVLRPSTYEGQLLLTCLVQLSLNKSQSTWLVCVLREAMVEGKLVSYCLMLYFILFSALTFPPRLFIALLSHWSTASFSENFPNRWNSNPGVIQNEIWDCLIYFSSNINQDIAQQELMGIKHWQFGESL